MKNGWQIKALGEVSERVTVGHVGITAPHYRDSGILFLRTQNVGETGLDLGEVRYITPEFHALLRKSEVKAGDILMSRVITHTVHCALVPNNLGPANCANVVLVRSGKVLLSEFLMHYIRSPEAQRHLLDRKVGSAQLVVNTTVVQNWPVPVPPIGEQRRIVGILDEAFDGIATAKANAEQNLQNARAVFDSYLQSVFTRRGADWVEKRLTQIGNTQTGSTPKTSDRANYGRFVPFVKPADFNADGSLDYEKDGLSEKGIARARVVPRGSVLMVCIGATIGKCGYCDRDVTTNQQINSLTPTDGSSHRFIYYQMLTEGFQRRVIHGSGQATLPIINKSKWSALPIWLPPSVAEQKRIADKFDALVAETQKLATVYEQKLVALEELKKSLLQQAFSGQL